MLLILLLRSLIRRVKLLNIPLFRYPSLMEIIFRSVLLIRIGDSLARGWNGLDDLYADDGMIGDHVIADILVL